MRKCELLLAIAAMTVVSAFWIVRTEGYEFMNMDDPAYVFCNAHVKEGLTADGLRWAATNVRIGNNWHPATFVSLMADVELSDGSTESMSRVMHRHNAILHGFCAALLFLVMMRLLGAGKGWSVPLALTLCWALHPLRAECVCWVAERKELLCTACSLLTILLWTVRRGWATALAIAAYALAIMSKSVAVTVPVILIAIDLMRAADWRRCVRARWWVWALLFLLAGGTSVFTLIAQAPAVAPNQDESSFAVKVANAFGAYAIHFSRVIAPVGLSFSRLYVNTVIWAAFIPGLALVGLMLWSAWRYLAGGLKSGSPAEAGFLAAAWIGAGLLPMCGLLRVGVEFNPDRYGHWVGAGLAVVTALLFGRLSVRLSRWIAVGLLGVTAVFAVHAWNYAATFRNTYELFTNTLARNPGHAEALSRLTTEYLNRFHDIDKAIELIEQSFAICPDEFIYGQLMMIRGMRARPEDFRRIRELGQDVAKDHSLDKTGAALTALGFAAMHDQNWREAISLLEDATARVLEDAARHPEKTPPVDDNRLRIAICKHNAGDRAEAAAIFEDLAKNSGNEAVRQRASQILQSVRQRQAAQR